LRKKRNRVFMAGSLAEEPMVTRAGWIARLVSPVVVKQERNVKVIQLVDLLWPCVIIERNSRRDLNVSPGKRNEI
jgi:hypothetical protein